MATQLNIQALIFIGVLGLHFAAHAQTATPNQIPELEQKLSAAADPAEKAALCNELCFAYLRKDVAKALEYGEQARTGAKAAGIAREEAKALNLLGVAVRFAADFEAALEAMWAAGPRRVRGAQTMVRVRPGRRRIAPTSARKREPCSPSTKRWSNERDSVMTSRRAISPRCSHGILRTWPIAFPTVFVVAPLVRRAVTRMTA